MSSENGALIVLTAPSGTGKSSLVHELIARETSLRFSISHTTRAPRAGERDGVDYHFVTPAMFESMRDHDDFLEWAQVHGHLYGTSWREIEAGLSEGAEILLDIDVQGARQVAARFSAAVTIFLMPPDRDTLERRLRGRGTESETSITERLRAAALEMRHYGSFRYLVVNETLEVAAKEIQCVLAAERARRERRRGTAERILATFPDTQP